MARFIPPRRPIPRSVTRPVAKGAHQNTVVTILGGSTPSYANSTFSAASATGTADGATTNASSAKR